MNILDKTLEKKVVILTQEKELYKTENHALQTENQQLKEQLNWFQKQIFGKKSERVISNLNEAQLTFEGLENLKTEEESEEENIPAHKRRKSNRNGQDKITFPSDIPMETTILDVSEDQKICKKTGLPLVKIGEEITHKLAHKPGSYYINKIIRPKYALPEEGVLTAELPDSIIPRCRVDESFLAEVLTRKFADHLPLYRISEILKREDINISRKLLSQWVVRCGGRFKTSSS